jgi:hypothetical protein
MVKWWPRGLEFFNSWKSGSRPEHWLTERTVALPDNAVIFQSWIWSHTGKLIESVGGADYNLVDMELFADPDDKRTRNAIMRYAATYGAEFSGLMQERMQPYVGAKALIVTLDWVPAIRHIVFAAARLGIPTVLLPHESVFADRERYYRHHKLQINTPACDVVLAWGDLQEDIFVSRGYPADRIIKVGAPKFDYVDRIRGLGRQPAIALGLDPLRPITTFAVQPLDSQFDARSARQSQNRAIEDVILSANRLGHQVVVRLPPSKDELLNGRLYKLIAERDGVVVDNPTTGYKLTAEEAVQVSDVMVSVNSTMLLEAVLAGKVAISTKYIEFEQIWDNLKIPVARNASQLQAIFLKAAASSTDITSLYNIGWAERALNNGPFDGQAARRASDMLGRICSGDYPIRKGYALTIPFQNAS